MAKTNSVEAQIGQVLTEYSEEVKRVAEDSCKSVAKEAAKILRATSPVNSDSSRAGRYARGWATKEEDGGTIVYNKTDWQLTHLLENGHDVKNQHGEYGHWNGIKHIEPVESWVIINLPIRVSRGLK